MCQPEYNPQIYILQLFSFLVSPFAGVDAVPGVLLNPLLAWEGYRGFFSHLIVKKKKVCLEPIVLAAHLRSSFLKDVSNFTLRETECDVQDVG